MRVKKLAGYARCIGADFFTFAFCVALFCLCRFAEEWNGADIWGQECAEGVHELMEICVTKHEILLN